MTLSRGQTCVGCVCRVRVRCVLLWVWFILVLPKAKENMGNNHGRQSFAPLQEEGKGEKKDLVIGPDSPKYGATAAGNGTLGKSGRRTNEAHEYSIQEADIIKPIQANQRGKGNQNKLVVSSNRTPYKIDDSSTSRPLTMTILCRLIGALVVVSLFVICISFLINILVRPTNSSRDTTIQGSVVVLLERLNPFWYKKSTVSKPKSYGIQIGWVECDQLSYYSEMFTSEHHSGRKANTNISYQQLLHFEPYSYLVEGSWIELDIIITCPPDTPRKDFTLLSYNSYEQYYKLLNPNTAYKAQFDTSIPLNCTIGDPNRISINVMQTTFIFFGIMIQPGTDFTYNFTVNRVSFNDSTIDYQCNLHVDETSCDLDLNLTRSTDSELCLIEFCTAKNEDSEPFYYVNVSFIRRYINWISITLIACAVSLLILLCAIGTYDIMRNKIYPVGKKSLAPFLHRKH